ncbi:type VI secretion system protein TssL, short form [Pantoea sp. RIT-PI-b]|uniref:type VI secretion system protein TssL, short form n=1 Tax=Pantoea sp. RIT-PI-b TaxID=1681195 RepID=UPI003511BD73
MVLMTSADHNISINTLDTLMQETWLLSLAIRNGQTITIDDALYQRCFTLIEQVQDKLLAAGAPPIFCEEITFAHSVFLDELIMTIPDTDISVWWKRSPLQGYFLAHLNGGEIFYERIRTLLHEPAPTETLVACYYRMLRFGYIGKCLTEDNEERISLMQKLKALLPEQAESPDKPIFIQRSPYKSSFWLRAPWVIRSGIIVAIAIATFIMNGHLQYLTGKG